ncbi:MAG: M20 metallopeptidase family protein [Fimbriimonas sp.]
MSLLTDRIDADLEAITAFRRDLHAHPELMYKETRTSAQVQAALAEAGIEFVPGLAGGTGVLGYIPATQGGGKTIAIRADMDALPIFEKTGKPYASETPGVMHACGHDGHTAILLGVGRALAKEPVRPNHVLLVFQPAEEGGAGGRRMCEDGALDGSRIGWAADMIFGLHCSPFTPLGVLATKVGPMMASTDDFVITIAGQGGHAAMPHVGVDPIVVAAHLVLALQTIASRNVDPIESVVVTVGKIEGGTASNIIPHTCKLVGTIRTLDSDVRALAGKRLRELAHSVAASFGATAEIEWRDGYPVTVNDPDATAAFRRIAASVAGAENVQECSPVMGGEDFSFYGHHVPACFYWLGLVPEGVEHYPGVHTPEFDFNDDALSLGIRTMCALALADHN